ncbi:MAG: biopolymer transporter ExbD [Oceanococcaceae bacterium]
MLQRRHRHRGQSQDDLNITAFLNLMVILVPFLLITAVFSRLAILEVALPAPATSEPQEPPEEEPLPPPTVLVRADALVLRAPDGSEERYAGGVSDDSLAELNAALQRIKFGDVSKDAAVVLLDGDTPYDTLIQVMDAVRLTRIAQDEEMVNVPMFPQISLGELPPRSGDPQ